MELSRDHLLLIIVIFMLLLIFLEIIIDIRGKKGVYSLKECLASFQFGLGQQAVNVIFVPLLTVIYTFILDHFAIFDIGLDSAINWIICFLFVDFTYYIAHRASHRINILVAAHTVHHQATDYNLISAFRQSWTAHIFVFSFYLPLALIGFRVEMFMLIQLLTMILQFFSHSGMVKKELGILEYILVTPRNHYAHHGISAKYIDCNCGGVLIIWDRLFGTYRKLTEDEIEIGVLGNINHYDPIESNFLYFKKILFIALKRKGFMNKFKIFFETPEVLASELEFYEFSKNDLAVILIENLNLRSCLLFIIGALVGTISLMAFGKKLALGFNIILCLIVVWFIKKSAGEFFAKEINEDSKLPQI